LLCLTVLQVYEGWCVLHIFKGN